MTLLCLDLVLGRTGFAILKNGKLLEVGAIDTKKAKLKGMERIDFITEKILELVHTYNPDHAVIEGYSMYGSGRITDLAEVGGIVRYLLHKSGVTFTAIAPKSMVMHVTGHGGSSKDDVRKVVNAKFKLSLNEKQNDESDAIGLGLAYIKINSEPKKEAA